MTDLNLKGTNHILKNVYSFEWLNIHPKVTQPGKDSVWRQDRPPEDPSGPLEAHEVASGGPRSRVQGTTDFTGEQFASTYYRNRYSTI